MKRLINQTPSPVLRVVLGLLPFVLLVVLYTYASDARLAENPADKLLPSFGQIGDAIQRMAFEPSKRSGDYLVWEDTLASLTRLGLGVLIAATLGLALGLQRRADGGLIWGAVGLHGGLVGGWFVLNQGLIGQQEANPIGSLLAWLPLLLLLWVRRRWW